MKRYLKFKQLSLALLLAVLVIGSIGCGAGRNLVSGGPGGFAGGGGGCSGST